VTDTDSVVPAPLLSATATSGSREPGERHSPAFAVELAVKSPCTAVAAQPVSAGIPFAKGLLHLIQMATPLGLTDPEGHCVPVQACPLAHWSDGSVKWLLLDLVLPSVAQGSTRYELSPGPFGADRSNAENISVQETNHSVVVATGTATFHLSRTSLPLDRVFVGSHEVLEPGSSDILLTDAKGSQRRPLVERVSVEARGPVRATVKYEGRFDGRVRCRFVARFCFFAQTGLVRMRLTVHNPNRARHRGGLWDLGDPGSMLFRDLTLQLGPKAADKQQIVWNVEPGDPIQSLRQGTLEIFQASSGGDNWQSKNHVNRLGQVPCPFRGYRVRNAQGEVFGLRANPVVSVQGSGGTLTAAVPEFWQQFPKALEAEGGQIRVRLFPEQWGDLFELQGGEQKTHTVWLHFGTGNPQEDAPLGWVHQPAQIQAPLEWYADSGAIPYLAPAFTEPDGRLESYLKDAVAGEKSFFANREIIDEYGWRHFGEIYADHEAAYYQGPMPPISHYNNQYDVIQGALVQYLRTGDVRWFALADPLARHVMDIDIYHTDQDKAQYNGGLFWFTDHYKDAATSSHRTYSRQNCLPGDRTYGGGPSSNHNFTTGLLYYYFLTGNPDARMAVLGFADWVINMDDGTQTLLRLIDDGPTGSASSTGYGEFHGPGRGSGNSINALLDAWLVSGSRAYLDKAETLIRRAVHPTDDIAALRLLDVEKRWSYTVFFVVLARYLAIKAESENLDDMYAYARASLLHYARWMLDHERPYFDHPEQLEYPTETWAAQEFRKANVLRLAAAHAEEPLRWRLLQRGEELANRGWTDLLRFDSRLVARAVALVMVDGSQDSYFRSRPIIPAPLPAHVGDFGALEPFLSQKLRVFAQLKTVPGLLRATLRVANPRNLLRLISHRL
jgi:hypothetical protein